MIFAATSNASPCLPDVTGRKLVPYLAERKQALAQLLWDEISFLRYMITKLHDPNFSTSEILLAALRNKGKGMGLTAEERSARDLLEQSLSRTERARARDELERRLHKVSRNEAFCGGTMLNGGQCLNHGITQSTTEYQRRRLAQMTDDELRDEFPAINTELFRQRVKLEEELRVMSCFDRLLKPGLLAV